ncbi:MAG: 4Fe-4S dicluster domain-containing protein [Firmicutes bacterium]|nr:4Fe-4S dicluster domain-containing protein [Bacillota bacterium]
MTPDLQSPAPENRGPLPPGHSADDAWQPPSQGREKLVAEDLLKATHLRPAPAGFISIADAQVCRARCPRKPCLVFCPSQVFSWEYDHVHVDDQRCLECGACLFGCPEQNIDWYYPPGGAGVAYRY